MAIVSGQLEFPSASGSGPRQAKMRHGFDHRIGQASVVLTGFTASFSDGDHHFGRLIVELQHRIVNESTTGPEVEVYGRLGLRDKSTDWDDAYSGQIKYCLITVPERPLPVIGPPLQP